MNKYGSDMDFNLIFQVTRYLFRIFRVEKLICMKKPFMKVANTSNVIFVECYKCDSCVILWNFFVKIYLKSCVKSCGLSE